MTSFVHVDQPTSHPGVNRAEAVFGMLRDRRVGFSGARGLAALLLSAVISALLVVADRLMTASAEGGLVAAWLVLWLVAFAGIAFFAGAAQSAAVRTIHFAREVGRRQAAARADAQFLEVARHDSRVLRDLKAAASRQEGEFVQPLEMSARAASLANVSRRTSDASAPSLYEAMRRVNLGKYY